MVKLTVNGTNRSFDGDDDMPLLWARAAGVRQRNLRCHRQTRARAAVVEDEAGLARGRVLLVWLPA